MGFLFSCGDGLEPATLGYEPNELPTAPPAAQI